MVRVKTAAKHISTSKLRRLHGYVESPSSKPSSNKNRTASADVTGTSKANASSRRQSVSRSRGTNASKRNETFSVASRRGRNETANTPVIKRLPSASGQRSRSTSVTVQREAIRTDKKTTGRSKSAPASKKSTTGHRRASFQTIVRNIAKEFKPPVRLSPMSVRVLDSFVDDMLQRLAAELKRLCEQTGRRTVSSNDVRVAVGLLLTGDLRAQAHEEGDRAVARYRRDRQ